MKRNLNHFLCIFTIIALTSCKKAGVVDQGVKPLAKTSTKTLTATSYPSYNTSPLAPDQTGVSSTATQLAAKFQLGWNIGNTLEATGGETAWGNPSVTQALIDQVKKKRFHRSSYPLRLGSVC